MAKNSAYQRAEQKIEETLRDKATHLDLSVSFLEEDNYKLTVLPSSLGKLTQLETLDLHNNQLRSLPDEIGKLTNLHKLILYSNQLTSLPDAIGKLTNLQELILYSNQLTSLPDAIGKLTNLQELILYSNQLTSLPDAIGKLTQLKQLSIDNNHLMLLPESIGKLANLHELHIHDNVLSSLPDAIGNLTNLHGLYIYNNQLSSLPDAIGNLTNLHELYLHENKLHSLPDTIGNLTNLHILFVHCNHLSSLPDPIGLLKPLKQLSLDRNQLRLLPDTIGRLTNLNDIHLHSNQLSILPDSIGNLTQLTQLSLNFNHLSSLPDEIGQLSQLTQLSLNNNRLSSLPDEIGQLSQLTQLSLDVNHLSSLPDEIGQLSQLTQLSLNNNRLSSLPDEIGQLSQLTQLCLDVNHLSSLPDTIGKLSQLTQLSLNNNRLSSLTDEIGQLSQLTQLSLNFNRLSSLPDEIGQLSQLTQLCLDVNHLSSLPDTIGKLTHLTQLSLANNQLSSLPDTIGQLTKLRELNLNNNPLNPELKSAYLEGTKSLQRYMQANQEEQVRLYEAKLILIGEGEVGKSCLLGALRGDRWEENRSTTHGIEIKPVIVSEPENGIEITLNGWDFGGQPVYRPTHQLFFSAPAVYLVVWKPREGLQQNYVKEWIKLVKYREPDAKILVVATHAKDRQPDIDRQEIWDLFGKDTVLGFYSVESKPDEQTNERFGISELKDAIGRVASSLPEMGRTYPKRWQNVRVQLRESGKAYLPLERVISICKEHGLEKEDSRLLLRICHSVGNLIHYEHDPALRDIVILKPDWLATAISFVLDDKETRDAEGLIDFSRMSVLWNNPNKPEEARYDNKLHPLFLRLMERFDLSYKVAKPDEPEDAIGFWQKNLELFKDGCDTNDLHYTSLIAQLVSDVRPVEKVKQVWPDEHEVGDRQQIQICQIVDRESGHSASAEGLFYQLIVRLHKYSLGRESHNQSVHWQRGLVLAHEYNGRALLEHNGNDIRITVRAPYPERFLSALTEEVKWLVENFWEGLMCKVMVPCIEPCGNDAPGSALFDVAKLISSKREGRSEYPCRVCDTWQNIDALLRNSPEARRVTIEELLAELSGMRDQLAALRHETISGFDRMDRGMQRILSKVDDAFTGLLQTLTNEAKDGPRLFSFEPVETGFWDNPHWVSEKFRLTLWCEHSRLPLTAYHQKGDTYGVYDLEIPRKWIEQASPLLKKITSVLGVVLPVASAAMQKVMDDTAFKAIENQLKLGETCFDAIILSAGKAADIEGDIELESRFRHTAHGGELRQLHAWLKEKDPSFGGLIRVQDKQKKFLWVHPQFECEY